MSDRLHDLLILTEQNELLMAETGEVDDYFDFINDICISLRDLHNEFIDVSIKIRDEHIPLPVALCNIISLYIEEHTFCPLIEHFYYCTRRLKYMNYYNNYIRQPNECQYYIDVAVEAKEIIKEVKNNIHANKKIIENSIPLLSNTRLLREYKNRIVMSRHYISRCVISYLDIDTFTDRYEVYRSQVREYNYAKRFVKERGVLY